jgi:hypothetical protein
MATAFELADTLPAFAAVSDSLPPPSSGRYSWVDPARLETVRAAESEAEAELTARFPCIGRGTMPVVRVPKF